MMMSEGEQPYSHKSPKCSHIGGRHNDMTIVTVFSNPQTTFLSWMFSSTTPLRKYALATDYYMHLWLFRITAQTMLNDDRTLVYKFQVLPPEPSVSISVHHALSRLLDIHASNVYRFLSPWKSNNLDWVKWKKYALQYWIPSTHRYFN